MVSPNNQPGWDSFARTNASDRFRRQSAAMGTPLTELIVREAKVEPGMQVLDVASGTGEPAISIAALLNGTGEVVATDVSEQPLKIGEQRAAQRGLSNIRFRIADVHQLPFDDRRFDRVTCRLGLMFFADLPKALREIRRVLKPGGQFTAVAWGPMHQSYFDATVGTILKQCPGLELSKSASEMFKFSNAGTLTAALLDAGFAEAHDEVRHVAWTWPGSPEEVWEYFQAVTVPFNPLLSAVPENKRALVDASVREAILPLYEDGEVRFGGQFIVGIGAR